MKLTDEEMETNVEIILNKLYPKSTYEGDFIEVENTVEGLKAEVEAEEETNIKVCNKNLLNLDVTAGDSFIVAGLTYTKINNSEFTLIGDRSGNYRILTLSTPIKLKAGKKYTLSTKMYNAETGEEISESESKENFNFVFGLYGYINEEKYSRVLSNGAGGFSASYTPETDMEIIRFVIEGLYSASYNIRVQLQLETADTATDYVEHKEQTYENTAKAKIKTYEDVTYIYNNDSVNMNATVRVEKEE